MNFILILFALIAAVAAGFSIFTFIESRAHSKKRMYSIFGIVGTSIVILALILSNLPSSPTGNAPSANPTATTGNPRQGTKVTTPSPITPTPSPTPSPTATSTPTSDYSAAQPGPHCDTNGGVWTAQGLSGITCGTWVSNSTANTWGYLFLQLPNNAAFTANNEISITFSNIDSLNSSCIGLAEIGQSSGYLVAYCLNGGNNEWTIYSISDQGTIIQPLSSNATSLRTNTTLSLTIVNNTLTFAIDVESHHISISPLLPTKVAIAFFNNGCGNCTAETSNFNYITPPS